MINAMDENGHYCLSRELGLTPMSVPPCDLVKRYFANQTSLSPEEKYELVDFDYNMVKLVTENDMLDRSGINYVANFIKCFCPVNAEFLQLTKTGQDYVWSLLYAEEDCVELALTEANCTVEFIN
jgi:hypothetical protein